MHYCSACASFYFKIKLYMSRHPEWLKPKGYLHITPSLDLKGNDTWVYKIQSPPYVARYAFFPLLYREIRHRRYRKPMDYCGKNRKKQHRKHQKKPPTKKHEKMTPNPPVCGSVRLFSVAVPRTASPAISKAGGLVRKKQEEAAL